MYYVPQILEDDCGFACLKMLLAKVHKDRNYLFLPQDESHGPYSFLDLSSLASKYGVTLTGYMAQKDQLKQHKNFPFIALITTSVGGAHAVVVEKISFGSVYYLDPSQGRKEISYRKFLQMWEGEMLQVDGKTYTPCPYKESHPIPKSGQVITGLFQVLACISIAFGVYFINENTYMFIPIILFALALIFEILLKSYSISLLKKADNYFYGQLEIKDGAYLKTVKRYERYKSGLLTSPLNFIISLCIVVLLMLVTLSNDIKNILLVLSPFAFSLIEASFYKPYIESGEALLSNDEKQLDNSEDDEDFKGKVYQIHKKAYKLGLLEMTKQYIGIALFVIMAVVTMAMTGVVSFPYIIFYSCLEFAIYQGLKTMLVYPTKYDELLKEKVEINNCLHQTDENK